MKQMILAYHIQDETRMQLLQQSMLEKEIDVRFVEQADYERTLADLLDITDDALVSDVPLGKQIDDEMLVFVGIPSENLGEILACLREYQIRISRKAMLTKSNQAWNAYQLFDELTQEMEYVKQMRKAS